MSEWDEAESWQGRTVQRPSSGWEPGFWHLCLERQLAMLLWHVLQTAAPFGCKSCRLLWYFLVCWDCLAEDGGGGMQTVHLVQNN